MGWLAGWSHRKTVTITGQAGAGTDYQVNLSIGDASGGDFHLENHCTSFPNDIQVTDNDQTTPLDYWVEDLTVDPISMWVEVADDLSSNVDICVYYGKSGESSASNITTTILFSDDFEDGDVSDWTQTNTALGELTAVGTPVKHGNYAGQIEEKSGGDISYSYKQIPELRGQDKVLEWEWRASDTTRHLLYLVGTAEQYLDAFALYIRLGTFQYYDGAYHTIMVCNADQWYKWKVLIKENDVASKFDVWIDDILQLSDALDRGSVDSIIYFQLMSDAASPYQYVDNIRVRNFVSPEPTFSSAGAEESAPVEGIGAQSQILNPWGFNKYGAVIG